MRRITPRLAVVATALLVFAGAAVAVAATRHFGYHKVREGLPASIGHFSLTSTDVRAGRPIPQQFWGCTDAGVSPEISWSGAPSTTRSFAILMFDPDAPTGSGFWHWAVYDIPANVSELPAGAGDEDGSALPEGAVQLRNDAGLARYLGAAPPSGHGRHRYMFVVHALDTESLGLDPQATPAFLGFNLFSHSLGRGTIVAWYET